MHKIKQKVLNFSLNSKSTIKNIRASKITIFQKIQARSLLNFSDFL